MKELGVVAPGLMSLSLSLSLSFLPTSIDKTDQMTS